MIHMRALEGNRRKRYGIPSRHALQGIVLQRLNCLSSYGIHTRSAAGALESLNADLGIHSVLIHRGGEAEIREVHRWNHPASTSQKA